MTLSSSAAAPPVCLRLYRSGDAGRRNILILERDAVGRHSEPVIHNGFGLRTFRREELTGRNTPLVHHTGA